MLCVIALLGDKCDFLKMEVSKLMLISESKCIASLNVFCSNNSHIFYP